MVREIDVPFAHKSLTQSSAFSLKNIFRYRHPVAIDVKTGMPPFGILANHKIKMCHNSMKKNNDTKDYSEQLEFLNSEPYYASNC